MTRLTIPLHLLYTKRFMETETKAKLKYTVNENDSNDKIQVDPEPISPPEEIYLIDPESISQVPDTPQGNILTNRMRAIFNNLSSKGQETVKQNMDDLNNMSTDTYDTISNKEPVYVPIDYTPEATLLDRSLKTFVASVDELGDRMGKEITKSTTLAMEWKEHITAYDKYIKSLQQIPWKRLLGYSAGLSIFMIFLWKMGAARALPDFLSNMIRFVPISTSPVKVDDIPKPNIDYTLKTVMETPLTPLAIVIGVGTLTIGIICLKGVLWAIRKIPK